MAGDDFAEARQLFFDYDGLRFHMFRDGVEDQYLSFGVPAQVEGAWLDELLEAKLALLTQPGNWWAVHFLKSHRKAEYLPAVAAAQPLGVWWERCSFLEMTIDYVQYTCRDHYAPERLADMCRKVAEQARDLVEGTPADQPPGRVNQLIARAEELAASFGLG